MSSEKCERGRKSAPNVPKNYTFEAKIKRSKVKYYWQTIIYIYAHFNTKVYIFGMF